MKRRIQERKRFLTNKRSDNMMGRGFYGSGACFAGGGLWGSLMMLGLFLLTAALAIWAVKRFTSKDHQMIEELKMKFVLGEITEEEYLKKKEVLKRK